VEKLPQNDVNDSSLKQKQNHIELPSILKCHQDRQPFILGVFVSTTEHHRCLIHLCYFKTKPQF